MKKNEHHHRTGRLVKNAYSSNTRQLGCVIQDMEPPKSSSILLKSSYIRKPIRCVKFTKAVVEKFGDLITADHKVFSEGCESRNNHRHAVVVQDLATQWIQAYPCKNKTSQETQRSSQKFLEPDRKPKAIYTDNSLEFGKACEDLSWNHCTSKPHRSETNGIAERAVRRVKEGTSAVLLQSGLDENWWADSMECYTYLRNVQYLLSDGMRPHMRDVLGNHLKDRSFRLFHWLIITLYLRKTSQESINLERKSYLDCSSDMHCTRGGIWKGDVLVADLEELETMDASEIYSKKDSMRKR